MRAADPSLTLGALKSRGNHALIALRLKIEGRDRTHRRRRLTGFGEHHLHVHDHFYLHQTQLAGRQVQDCQAVDIAADRGGRFADASLALDGDDRLTVLIVKALAEIGVGEIEIPRFLFAR